MSNRISEDGRTRVAESIAGVVNASTLNDANIALIIKELFTTNPADNGWSIGTGWVWNDTNGNMEPV